MILFWILRVIFYLGFSEVGNTIPVDFSTLLGTLYIGFKFDIRLAILICLPILPAVFMKYNLLNTRWIRSIVMLYLSCLTITILLLYILDFGHYIYLGSRIDASILRFFNDIKISAAMVWDSYPVIPILIAWISVSTGFIVWANFLLSWTLSCTSNSENLPLKLKAAYGTLTVLLIVGGLFGQIGTLVPLRWNHAFFSGKMAVGALGLNPVLQFYESYIYRNAGKYDEKEVRKYYDVVSDYLGVENPDINALNYQRAYPAKSSDFGIGERPPNIVIIMLESLGASRLGMFGNPLKPSPNLDKLAADGWFFKRFYVPVSGTARTVWATVTSLPDVSIMETASRNPIITEQHSLINAFDKHEKIYAIGGNSGWAHIGGIWRLNIKGLKLYEEGYWKSPAVDVWGISDLNLFKESNEIFKAIPSNQPFFAFVQTAGNHRPFTVPEENDGFERIEVPSEELEKWGYRNVDQFNAVRLLDFNIGKFMDMAKEAGYFDNTIFVLYGDHNNRITKTPHMPAFYEQLDLDGLHVPAIIYAPKILGKRVIESATSLVDIMPTLAGILGVNYVNASLGRDIALDNPSDERYVFTLTSQVGNPVIGAISKDYMLRMQHDSSNIQLHALNSPHPELDVSDQFPEKTQHLSALARGIYETGKWMFYHNQHQAGDPQL